MTKLPRYKYIYAKDLRCGDLLIEAFALNGKPTVIELLGIVLDPTIRLADEDAAKGFSVETMNVSLQSILNASTIDKKYPLYQRLDVIRTPQEE